MDERLKERLSRLGPIRPLEKSQLSSLDRILTFDRLADIGCIRSFEAIMALYKHTSLNLLDAKRLIEDVLINQPSEAVVHSADLPALTQNLEAAGVKITVL